MKNRPYVNREMILVSDLINQTTLFPILHDIYVEVRKARKNVDIVMYHRNILGSERCSSIQNKYWIWDKDNYRVIVSNVTGIQLEVSLGADFEKIKTGIKTYLSDMSIPLSIQNYI